MLRGSFETTAERFEGRVIPSQVPVEDLPTLLSQARAAIGAARTAGVAEGHLEALGQFSSRENVEEADTAPAGPNLRVVNPTEGSE